MNLFLKAQKCVFDKKLQEIGETSLEIWSISLFDLDSEDGDCDDLIKTLQKLERQVGPMIELTKTIKKNEK